MLYKDKSGWLLWLLKFNDMHYWNPNCNLFVIYTVLFHRMYIDMVSTFWPYIQGNPLCHTLGVMSEIPKSPKSVRERQHKGKCPHKFDQHLCLYVQLSFAPFVLPKPPIINLNISVNVTMRATIGDGETTHINYNITYGKAIHKQQCWHPSQIQPFLSKLVCL